jgi:hypothetical protein
MDEEKRVCIRCGKKKKKSSFVLVADLGVYEPHCKKCLMEIMGVTEVPTKKIRDVIKDMETYHSGRFA